MKRKSIILIDGSNFYFKLKDLKLHNLLKFNFHKFAKFLAGDTQIVGITYYIGRIRTDGSQKSLKMFKNQQRLLSALKKYNTRYSFGYLLKSDGVFHEKGVDVHLAVDILIATYENLCDQIIVVSSDTDLLPAIKKAQEKKKTVEYVGFSHQPSLAMISKCKESRLLKKEDLVKFCQK